MENKRPTFEQTLDKLVRAYLKGELQHQDCTKCVVGNLCGGRPLWEFLFITDASTGIQSPRMITPLREAILNARADQILEAAIVLCASTGYTIPELKRIEYAFETAPGYIPFNEEREEDPNEDNDEWMFNGLMAVVDVLADIHGKDLSQKEEAKKLFVKV